jgi:hypothetical protein
VSLVTHQYAEKAGFGRRPASIRITGVGVGSGGESSVQYKALLRRRDGSIAEIKPYGVDKITGNAKSLNLGKAKSLFLPSYIGVPSRPHPTAHWNGPYGRGPREEDRAQGVVLYSLKFGTGYMAGGNMTCPPGHKPTPAKVLSCRTVLFNPRSSYQQRPWGQRCPAGVLHAGTARNAKSAWID